MKNCKGTGKAKGYGCGLETHIHKFGLCKSCFIDWCFNTESGKTYFNKVKLKAKTIVNASTCKEHKKERKEATERLKTLTQLEKEAKLVFQKWVRLRDDDKPCISCGTFSSKIWDGGHLYKAEIFSGVIFDELNVNKQCRKCNFYLGGNEMEYKKHLIKLIGEHSFANLEARANQTRFKKWERSELIEIKKKYQSKIKNNLF